MVTNLSLNFLSLVFISKEKYRKHLSSRLIIFNQCQLSLFKVKMKNPATITYVYKYDTCLIHVSFLMLLINKLLFVQVVNINYS